MTPQQEQLFKVRAEQVIAEIDAFLKHMARDGATVPQALADALEAFREAVKEGDSQ